MKSGNLEINRSLYSGKPDERSSDGEELQMTLFSFAARGFRVRAFKTVIDGFHSQIEGGSQPRSLHSSREGIQYPDSWFVKVVCSVFIHKQSLSDDCLCYLSENVTPFVANEVIKELNNPRLGYEFLEFSRSRLHITHTWWTYNFLIRSLCRVGLNDLARKLLEYMRSDGHSPDSHMLGFLTSYFANVGNLDFALNLLSEAIACEIEERCLIVNGFLNVLIKQNQVEEAVRLFEEYPGLKSCADTWTCNILLRGLSKVGNVHKALGLFGDMGSFGCSPDIVTYNTLINGFCKINDVERARELLDELRLKGVGSPDVVSYTSTISGYCRLGNMEEAYALFDEMISCGVEPTVVTFNVLIDGFGKANDIVSMESICGKMAFYGCSPDVVTFTSMIDGYCRRGQLNQGLRLLDSLNARGLSPNVYTFCILVNALCKENRLREARDLLRQLKYSNVVPKPFIYNPVIDGFCKAGNIDEANEIVKEMEEKQCCPDKVTFTILIIGHCMKGRMFEAIKIFNKMLVIGCSPDSITITSLVSCLLKAGMAKEAHRIRQLTLENLNATLTPSEELFSSRKSMEIPVAA